MVNSPLRKMATELKALHGAHGESEQSVVKVVVIIEQQNQKWLRVKAEDKTVPGQVDANSCRSGKKKKEKQESQEEGR